MSTHQQNGIPVPGFSWFFMVFEFWEVGNRELEKPGAAQARSKLSLKEKYMKIGVNNTACGRYGIDYIFDRGRVFHVSIGFLGFRPSLS